MIFRHTKNALRQKHSLPTLLFKYSALEPFIHRDIMETHYTKHHAAYVDKLNAAEEQLSDAEAKGDIKAILKLGPILKFNGGGHINHSIFWKNLTDRGVNPPEPLEKAILNEFESWGAMQSELASAALSIQGSGWSWLGYNYKHKRMEIATCNNQDPLETTTGLIPLLGIDMWEHAYYLQYKNARADYLKAIFNVVNWDDVYERYDKATKYDTYPTLKS